MSDLRAGHRLRAGRSNQVPKAFELRLADVHRRNERDRAALLELTELAGMRSPGDGLARVTAYVLRRT